MSRSRKDGRRGGSHGQWTNRGACKCAYHGISRDKMARIRRRMVLREERELREQIATEETDDGE